MIRGRGLFGFLGVIVAVATIAFSCEPPVDLPSGKGLSLSWEGGALKVGYGATDASLTVVARADWTLTVTEGANWLGSPSVSSGAEGTTTVRFNFSENPGETTRTAKIRLVAEGEEDAPYECVITQTYRGVLAGVNEWIYNGIRDWYYWQDAVAAATVPNAELDYDEFLIELLENAYTKGAKDNTENPPTIDGSYTYENGRFTRKEGYVYSYIERREAGTRAWNASLTFGMDITAVSGVIPQDTDRNAILVIWVSPGGPADKAGLRRGMWIYRYNDKPIYDNDVMTLWNQLYDFQGGTTLNVTGRDGTAYSLVAENIIEDPLLHYEVITTEGGKRVAYLMYNAFTPGDDYVFDDRMRDIFKGFKEAGATELVLDLRYNNGGAFSSSHLLSSLAGNVTENQVFANVMFNPKVAKANRWENPEVHHFLDEANGLKLPKIYVLATGQTASSSELVINSLRGVLGDEAVVLIGGRTQGKNVGTTPVPVDGSGKMFGAYGYVIWPITFKTSNARGFAGYAGGFAPTFEKNEFWAIQNVRNAELYDFGDPRERLLKAALEHIDTGTVTADPDYLTTRATTITAVAMPDRRPGGMKYIPRTER